jgi:hypothetical protein
MHTFVHQRIGMLQKSCTCACRGHNTQPLLITSYIPIKTIPCYQMIDMVCKLSPHTSAKFGLHTQRMLHTSYAPIRISASYSTIKRVCVRVCPGLSTNWIQYLLFAHQGHTTGHSSEWPHLRLSWPARAKASPPLLLGRGMGSPSFGERRRTMTCKHV